MLFSKNQLNCDSVTFSELRVVFHLHVELIIIIIINMHL